MLKEGFSRPIRQRRRIVTSSDKKAILLRGLKRGPGYEQERDKIALELGLTPHQVGVALRYIDELPRIAGIPHLT
jgi:hypothetical protein